MSHTAGNVYVEKVCELAVAELDRFLRDRTRPRNGAKMLVRLEIKTKLRLDAAQERQIEVQLDRVRAHHTWARCWAIFTVDPGLTEQSCEITPREVGTDDGGSSTAAAPPATPLLQRAVLTLQYEDLTFAYVLTSREQWVTLHRPDRPRQADAVADIVIPASMSGVPAGSLLAVWYHEPEFGLCRLPHRQEINVTVSGNPWPVGHSQVIERSGTISYADLETGRKTTFRYRLEPWSWLIPEVITTPDRGDSRPHQVVLTSGATEIVLDVQPPASDASPAARRFPLPAPDQSMSHHDIHTLVLYTRANSAAGVRHWHVKLFRCATGWHARLLRNYLRNQAVLIDRVNYAHRGSPLRPPWAIAPVHVLSAEVPSSLPPPTDYDPDTAEISANPENRLSSWFGVPDHPQPDCYVVVASPELNRVTWRTKRGSPGHEQLRLFTSMAVALDTCHELGVAHGDIKPENVCFSDLSDGYVLVDGDSVSPLDAVSTALRFTDYYASQAMINRAVGGLAPGRSELPRDDVLLKEHDRFGFVLVVLTALAGSDVVNGLLKRDENGGRDVDHPRRVQEMITGGWQGDWEPLVEVLTAPFQPEALMRRWSAAGWLDKLDKAYEVSLERQRERQRQDLRPPHPAGRYDEHIGEIRRRVRERGPLPRPDLPVAVIKEVEALCFTVAARAQGRVFAWCLIPVALAAFVLVAAILDI